MRTEKCVETCGVWVWLLAGVCAFLYRSPAVKGKLRYTMACSCQQMLRKINLRAVISVCIYKAHM